MIAGRVCERIVNWLLEKECITEKESCFYRYCLECVIEQLLFFVTFLFVGVAVGKGEECFWFLVTFHLLRSTAGGWHAETAEKCKFFSLITYVIIIVLLEILPKNYFVFDAIIYFCSLLFVFRFSPIDTKNRPLNKEKKWKMHKKCGKICIILGIFFLISIYMKKTVCLNAMILSSLLTLTTQVLGMHQNTKTLKENEVVE